MAIRIIEQDQIISAEVAEWIVAEIERRGLSLHSECRFKKYARSLKNNEYSNILGYYEGDQLRQDELRLLSCHSAIKDIDDVDFILRNIPNIRISDLRKLCDDHVVPRDNRSTPGRDTQIELLIHAVCLRSGMQVVQSRSDVCCLCNNVWMAIEAKRVRKKSAIITRIKEAAEQIRKSGFYYGLIVIDTSLAWNPQQWFIISKRSPDEIRQSLAARSSEFISKHESDVERIFSSYHSVLGILWVNTSIVHSGPLLQPFRTSTFYFRTSGDRRQLQQMNAVRSGIFSGFPNMQIYSDNVSVFLSDMQMQKGNSPMDLVVRLNQEQITNAIYGKR